MQESPPLPISYGRYNLNKRKAPKLGASDFLPAINVGLKFKDSLSVLNRRHQIVSMSMPVSPLAEVVKKKISF